ncbi:MAG: hypothetical protein AAF405_07655, partial [Pseudomonadota bacterium]
MVDPARTDPDQKIHADNERIEGTVFTTRHVRLLKVIVIALGVLILAALGAVIAGIFYQASKPGKSAEAPAHAAAPTPPADPVAMEPRKSGLPPVLDIPSGADVVSMSLDGNRLALHVRSQESAEIVIVDLRT